MLKELYLRNFVIIDELNFEPGPGFTVITGETGAGKSILVGALQALLGGRVNQDLVRLGEERAVVRGVFAVPPLPEDPDPLLDGAWEEEEWILERIISSKGGGKTFFNGRRVTLATLKAAGVLLLDLHGQHEHQSILNVSTHLTLLDSFGGLELLALKVKKLFNKYEQMSHMLNAMERSLIEGKDRREMLLFKKKEITELSPEENEDIRLEKEKHLLERTEEITMRLTSVVESLFSGESSAVDLMAQAERELSKISGLDDRFSQWRMAVGELVSGLSDLGGEIESFLSGFDSNRDRLLEVDQRLVDLKSLARKYGGGTLEGVFNELEKIKNELSESLDLSDKITEARKETEKVIGELMKAAGKLSNERKKAARKLNSEVTAELAGLAMEEARFMVNMTMKEDDSSPFTVGGKKVSMSSSGLDKVEFHLAPNKGEKGGPLALVSSGGELSRVMLALKKVLSSQDLIPTMIFDEIDTGIGGITARRVGECLSELAVKKQVICVTHLPVIASKADNHFMVEKVSVGDRTLSRFHELNFQGRREELARMVGVESGDADVSAAADLFAINNEKRKIQTES